MENEGKVSEESCEKATKNRTDEEKVEQPSSSNESNEMYEIENTNNVQGVCERLAGGAKQKVTDEANVAGKPMEPIALPMTTAVGEMLTTGATAAATANTVEKKDHFGGQNCFSQKVAALQEKTKNLRTKLGLRRHDLQQQADAVRQSSEVRRINDAMAAQAMTTLEKNAAPSEVSPSTSVSTVPTKLATATAKVTRGTPRRTRRELQDQVEGLQELLSQLTMHNPQLKERVHQLAQSNPKLRQFELNTVASASRITAKPRQDSERSVASSASMTARAQLIKQRRESELSNSSTATSQKDTTTTNIIDGAGPSGSGKSGRKRGQRKRKNKSNKPAKSQASEMEALSKYINTIVAEYLGPEQKERAVELEFKGTVEDLESHAQKLVQSGLGRIVEEEIRINRKNNRQSFITMCADREGPERDGIILLPVARRYAFEGDIVRAFVMNAGAKNSGGNNSSVANDDKKKSGEAELVITGGKDNSFSIADDEDPFAIDEDTESPDSDADPNELDVSAVVVPDNCPKSFVIMIIKQTELREIVGTISFKNSTKLNDEQCYYKLKPYDMRVPMVYVPVESSLEHITTENKADICGLLYLVRILETDANGHCIGELIHPVGKVGDMEAEMKAILLHNGLKDIRPFEQKFVDMYAASDPLITATDLTTRKDLRKKCIFTIDPLTARDLDDAVSVEYVAEDDYEVGVHISDVAHYLVEDSELDNIVKTRATSIYLVNEVIHMLPQTLCFKCSLLPGEDKFAFSVFWRMNLKGELLSKPAFTRTVINSCSQLAYEHAQKVINNPNEEFDVDDFPTICNGFTVEDICSRIKLLNTIAEELRKKRFDDGALSINNPKLRFQLDPKTGEPLSYEVDGRQEANFLIEEYMLLANQSVARFIYDRFPDISILRHHAPPLSKSMKNLKEKLNSLGLHFDWSTSKTVYASMQRLCQEAKDPRAMDACLSTLLTKPMARAKYFCSEGKTEEADLWHYALSIPIYTHFTSPIRRYPDILVHRILAAALDYCAPPKRTTDELHMLAKICNDQKYNAKNAGDESVNLFFKRYIKEKQSITLRAVVTEIYQHLLNVVTIETGHAISIHYKMQKVLVDTTNAPAYVLIAEKNSKAHPLKLQIFSTVDVKLVIWDEKICGFFASPDPKQRQLNSIELSKKKQLQQTTASTSNANNDNGARKQRRISQRTATEQTDAPAPAQTTLATATAASTAAVNPPKPKLKSSTKNNEKRVYALRDENENN